MNIEISIVRDLLRAHGRLSVPFIQRKLKCTSAKAKKILAAIYELEQIDTRLPLKEFISTYIPDGLPRTQLSLQARKRLKLRKG